MCDLQLQMLSSYVDGVQQLYTEQHQQVSFTREPSFYNNSAVTSSHSEKPTAEFANINAKQRRFHMLNWFNGSAAHQHILKNLHCTSNDLSLTRSLFTLVESHYMRRLIQHAAMQHKNTIAVYRDYPNNTRIDTDGAGSSIRTTRTE